MILRYNFVEGFDREVSSIHAVEMAARFEHEVTYAFFRWICNN